MEEEQKVNILTESVFTIFGIVLGIVVLCCLFIILNYFNILNLSQKIPFLSFLPQKKVNTISKELQNNQNYSTATIPPTQSLYPPQSSADLQSCKARQQGNSLVVSVNTVNNVIVGQYKGKITAFTLSNDKTSASLTLVSLDGRQQEQFTIPSQASIYTIHPPGPSIITHLKNGQTVDMTFNCFTDQNNLFKITQVGIDSQ